MTVFVYNNVVYNINVSFCELIDFQLICKIDCFPCIYIQAKWLVPVGNRNYHV